MSGAFPPDGLREPVWHGPEPPFQSAFAVNPSPRWASAPGSAGDASLPSLAAWPTAGCARGRSHAGFSRRSVDRRGTGVCSNATRAAGGAGLLGRAVQAVKGSAACRAGHARQAAFTVCREGFSPPAEAAPAGDTDTLEGSPGALLAAMDVPAKAPAQGSSPSSSGSTAPGRSCVVGLGMRTPRRV